MQIASSTPILSGINCLSFNNNEIQNLCTRRSAAKRFFESVQTGVFDGSDFRDDRSGIDGLF